MAALPVSGERVLEIRNYLQEGISVEVDSRPLVELEAGETAQIEDAPEGRHEYVAMAGGRVVARVTATLPAKGHYVWPIGEENPTTALVPLLRIRDYAGKPIEIVVQGHPRIRIEPGEAATLTGVPSGPVELEALDLRGGLVARETVEMVNGMEQVWTVSGPEGPLALVRVTNHTGEPIRACVDGADFRQVEPGASVDYVALQPGPHTIRALALDSDRVLDEIDAELMANTPHEWVAGTEEV